MRSIKEALIKVLFIAEIMGNFLQKKYSTYPNYCFIFTIFSFKLMNTF